MKLSVVMITYNHEHFIAQALSSVLAQRVNFDYEIIVAEDCSTDATRGIVMDFQRRNPDKIIPLLRERNLGVMRNFREALARCRGEYVALLEGDDYWTSQDKVQRQVDLLDAHDDYAICCHRAQLVDERAGGKCGISPGLPSGSYTITDLLDMNWIMTATVVYRRGSIGPLPDWFVTLKMADWPLHILAARSGKIFLMDEVMSVYRIHPGGVWSSLSPADQFQATKQMLRKLDKYLGFRYTDTIRQAIASPYLRMAEAARLNGSRTQTAKHLFEYACNGGWQLRGSGRLLAGLAAYALIGSWYKHFSRAKSASDS
jgi:glycosyltransferase involved in cell wall biosynthesis